MMQMHLLYIHFETKHAQHKSMRKIRKRDT